MTDIAASDVVQLLYIIILLLNLKKYYLSFWYVMKQSDIQAVVIWIVIITQ